jgi:hypothetical protein
MGGQPGAVVLLGCHGVEPGLQAAAGRGNAVLPVEEGDSVFKLAAVITQLKRRHGVQGMLGLVDGYGFCWHWWQILTQASGGGISLPNLPGR